MKLINDVSQQRFYKYETAILSLLIFEKYLNEVEYLEKLDKKRISILIATSVLLGAKVEQPLQPSIKNILKAMKSQDPLYEEISHEEVEQMELSIVLMLDFDFRLPTPFPFLERYLYLLGYDQQPEIVFLSQMMVLKSIIYLQEARVTEFKNSILASSSVLLAYCAQEEIGVISADLLMEVWNEEI